MTNGMTQADAEAIWRAEANQKITTHDLGSSAVVLIERLDKVAEFLAWAWITKADAVAAAEEYAGRLREAYVDLAKRVASSDGHGVDRTADQAEMTSEPVCRTVFTVEVFSRGPYTPPDGDLLAIINYDITDGPWIGNVEEVGSDVVPPDQVEAEMLRIGNDGSFFEETL